MLKFKRKFRRLKVNDDARSESLQMVMTVICSWNEFSLNSSKFDADSLYVFKVVFVIVRFSDLLRKAIEILTIRNVKKIQHFFLGTFTKLRKATISFVMSVRLSVLLSVRMEQLSFHRTDFYEIWDLYFMFEFLLLLMMDAESVRNM